MRLLLALTLIFNSHAQNLSETKVEAARSENSISDEDNTIYIFGTREKAFESTGSAHYIGEETLGEMDYSDIGRVLDKIPGVYIQEEDGVGLRPNIGLRGAHPHRSKKVTLMEDGILIGPAPYSAPAAYYFPTPTKASSIEVFKGPSAVKYGPNSIGGAVNIVTTPISKKNTQEASFSYGVIQKAKVSASDTKGTTGYLLELHNIQSDGFKTLPNGESTGFDKNDLVMKFEEDLGKRLGVAPQKLFVKASIANEDSNETYLGLSEEDFARDPMQRYAGSQDDKMKWDHIQAQVKHNVRIKGAKVTTTFYHHQFARDWGKFSAMNVYGPEGDRLSPVTILEGPDNNKYKEILRGNRDSVSSDENIVFTDSNRKYLSQGLQFNSEMNFDTENTFNTLNMGLRLHNDWVERDHSEVQKAMTSGDLKVVDGTQQDTTQNKDTSNAVTLFVENETVYNDLTVSIGSRFESVKMKREDYLTNKTTTSDANYFVPGFGVNYLVSENLVAVGGINRGVTINGPGQDSSVDPEQSVNYEAGIKLKAPVFLEAIAFYSDYSNLKGTCTFSAGCDESDLDKEYNGGEAEIFGLESAVSHDLNYGDFHFPISLSYTYTVARFTQDTVSDNPEWGIGEIKAGDPLPYVPQDQVALKLGANYKKFASFINISWKGEMADQSAQVSQIDSVTELSRSIIDSHGVVDWSLAYKYSKGSKIFAKVDNIFDNVYTTSLRPYGARPGKPRMFSIGFDHKF